MDQVGSQVGQAVDWGLFLRNIVGLIMNPPVMVTGVLALVLIVGAGYLIYQAWINKQKRKMAEVGQRVDRDEFMDREAEKSKERNDKDNAGRKKLEDAE